MTYYTSHVQGKHRDRAELSGCWTLPYSGDLRPILAVVQKDESSVTSLIMPKVVSRAVVSSSDQARPTRSSQAVLRSYYCLCGDFVLVLQGKLDRLPQRKSVSFLHHPPYLDSTADFGIRSDGSYILRSQDGKKDHQVARKFKLNALPGQRCLIKR
jgi:hypothetical protein